jgi:hypothetical protein
MTVSREAVRSTPRMRSTPERRHLGDSARPKARCTRSPVDLGHHDLAHQRVEHLFAARRSTTGRRRKGRQEQEGAHAREEPTPRHAIDRA